MHLWSLLLLDKKFFFKNWKHAFMPAQQCCAFFQIWELSKWVGTWLSNTRGFFWGFLLILGTCWKKILSKYGNFRIFWRLGTYFQNKSFVSLHIDLFGLPGCTEEEKKWLPSVESLSVNMPQEDLAKFVKCFFSDMLEPIVQIWRIHKLFSP